MVREAVEAHVKPAVRLKHLLGFEQLGRDLLLTRVRGLEMRRLSLSRDVIVRRFHRRESRSVLRCERIGGRLGQLPEKILGGQALELLRGRQIVQRHRFSPIEGVGGARTRIGTSADLRTTGGHVPWCHAALSTPLHRLCRRPRSRRGDRLSAGRAANRNGAAPGI